MTNFSFESVGAERGVLALEAIGADNWAGIVFSSFDATNTPEVFLEWQPRVTEEGDIDATLCQAFNQYDNLLRRLSD